MSVFRLATSHAAPAARAAVQRPFPSTLSAPAVTHRGLCGQLAACAQAGGAGGVYSAFNLGTPLRPFCSNGSGAGGSKSGSSSNGASDLISKLAEPTFIANAVTAVALLYIASNLQEQKQKGDAATATATAAEFEERRLNAVKQRILEGNRNRMAAQETTRGQEGLSIVGRKADLAMLDQFVTIPGLYALVGDNGAGKSTLSRQFCSTRPHCMYADVWGGSIEQVTKAIAEALGYDLHYTDAEQAARSQDPTFPDLTKRDKSLLLCILAVYQRACEELKCERRPDGSAVLQRAPVLVLDHVKGNRRLDTAANSSTAMSGTVAGGATAARVLADNLIYTVLECCAVLQTRSIASILLVPSEPLNEEPALITAGGRDRLLCLPLDDLSVAEAKELLARKIMSSTSQTAASSGATQEGGAAACTDVAAVVQAYSKSINFAIECLGTRAKSLALIQPAYLLSNSALLELSETRAREVLIAGSLLTRGSKPGMYSSDVSADLLQYCSWEIKSAHRRLAKQMQVEVDIGLDSARTAVDYERGKQVLAADAVLRFMLHRVHAGDREIALQSAAVPALCSPGVRVLSLRPRGRASYGVHGTVAFESPLMLRVAQQYMQSEQHNLTVRLLQKLQELREAIPAEMKAKATYEFETAVALRPSARARLAKLEDAYDAAARTVEELEADIRSTREKLAALFLFPARSYAAGAAASA